MAARTRRARILAIVLFTVIAFVLYTRRSTPVVDYGESAPLKPIGGGAVMRPQPEEDPDPVVQPHLQTSTMPALVILKSSTKVAPRPAPPTTSSTTTTSQTSSSSSSDADATPAPLNHGPQIPSEDHDFPNQVGEGRVEVDVIPSPTAKVIHWSQMTEHFPIQKTIQLPSGTSNPMPRIQRAVEKLSANGSDQEKLAVIKGATEHAWRGYTEYAWAQDEVKPVSGGKRNPFNAWGATLVDSLDTLWVVGMEKEFEEAVEAVKNIDFTISPRPDIPVFETTIRYLGGLIAAYDVSGKKHIALLDKAVQLADILFSIFDTPNRMPQTFYRWKPAFASQPHRAGTRVVLAEIGTLSLEFTRLAQLTGEPKYYDAIARITDAFEEWQNSTRLPGMWPTVLDASGCGKPARAPIVNVEPSDETPGKYMISSEPVGIGEQQEDPVAEPSRTDETDFSNRKRQLDPVSPPSSKKGDKDNSKAHDLMLRQLQQIGTTGSEVCLPQGLVSTKNLAETFTLSGASDSMYEYLPKEYILLGGQVDQYRTMYLDSADAAIERLLYRPMTRNEKDILMTGELRISPNYSQPIETREMIETFKPEAAHLACFAGGMFAMGGVLFGKPEHVEIGSKLTDGCVWAYNVTTTGIMPEGAELLMCEDTWGVCPWNETAWWKAMDPYEEGRTKIPDPLPEDEETDTDGVEPAKFSPAAGDAPQVPKPAPADIGPEPKIDLERKEAESAGPLGRRQLVDTTLDDPPPPRPAQPEIGQGEARKQPPSSDYQPEKPLSHEEFVQKKIQEERLPPGYTWISSKRYILRPEAIESVFYMYRITGDQYWRDVGWDMFTSIDRYTRTLHGHSAIDDVTKSAPEPVDSMESFWIAETLKYFYLLYDDPSSWSLDEWVLNTEAHLFKRPAFDFADV